MSIQLYPDAVVIHRSVNDYFHRLNKEFLNSAGRGHVQEELSAMPYGERVKLVKSAGIEVDSFLRSHDLDAR